MRPESLHPEISRRHHPETTRPRLRSHPELRGGIRRLPFLAVTVPSVGLLDMEYTKLGRTGFEVTRIRLGCMSYGKWGQHAWNLGEEESRPFIKRALEAGINFFDTADRYVPTRWWASSEHLAARSQCREKSSGRDCGFRCATLHALISADIA
jgi:hypothetical protein